MRCKPIMLILTLLTLSACGMTMTEKDFENQTPKLVLEDFFSGNLVATGLFEDRFGNIRTQFTVDITGTFDGKTLTLDENFVYSDKSTEFRRWVIEKTGPDSYSGTTEQAIGEAVGTSSGNSFHWTYKFRLNVGDDIWKVKFDDWMVLQPNGVLLNKATVYRWGIKIGTVFLSFRKADAVAAAEAEAARLAS